MSWHMLSLVCDVVTSSLFATETMQVKDTCCLVMGVRAKSISLTIKLCR